MAQVRSSEHNSRSKGCGFESCPKYYMGQNLANGQKTLEQSFWWNLLTNVSNALKNGRSLQRRSKSPSAVQQ
jgi:hypothetical protein